MIEQQLYNSSYENLTQSNKRKEKRNDDVLVIDTTVDTNFDNDTTINNNINDNDNSNKNLTWNVHGFQSTYGDINGLQHINYGDVDHKIDITKRITLVNKMNKYQSYKDACNNNTITHTITPPVFSE